MSSLANNITRISPNNVFNHLTIFLRKKAKSSLNTAKKYEKDIRDFFLHVRNKNIEDLTPKDLKVTNAEVEDYHTFLSEKYKNSVANDKITALRSLYKFLKTNDYDVNPYAIIVEKLPDDTKSYGFLTLDEINFLVDLVMEYETHNKYMKRALIMLAFATSLRQNALLNLKYSDIRQSETDENKYLIEPDFLDKGKKISKEIHVDVYNMLIEAKEKDARERTDDKIFTMDSKGISKMMQRLVALAGFDPRRNISFHSIRKAGADFVYEHTGGDMAAVTAQGDWADPTTPYKIYLKKKTNLAGMAAFEKIDENIFDQLSHEELLALVKNIGNGIGVKLKSEAQNIIKSR